MRLTVILKNNGQLPKGPEEVLEHWYQHFRKVLNVQSIYTMMRLLLLCLFFVISCLL